MKALLVYAFFFGLLYLLFKKMMVWMHVSMSGWQFIVLILVLAGIAELIVTRIGSSRS